MMEVVVGLGLVVVDLTRMMAVVEVAAARSWSWGRRTRWMEEARLDQGSRLMELIGPWLAPVGDDRGVERTGEVGGRVRMAEVVGLLWSASGDSQARAGARRLGSRVGEGLADGPGVGGGQESQVVGTRQTRMMAVVVVDLKISILVSRRWRRWWWSCPG